MKELTVNEVKKVSGARTLGEIWSFGPISWAASGAVGLITGGAALPVLIAGRLGSLYDNVDWNRHAETLRISVWNKYIDNISRGQYYIIE